MLALPRSLSRQEREELLALQEERAARERQRASARLFPDDGPLARFLYPKHMEFFSAGSRFRERALIAANRVGKTTAGAYETALHLTGAYPDWWTGKRFDAPVRWWAAGKTNETTKEIVQTELLGSIEFRSGRKRPSGTGMVPGAAIGDLSFKAGVPDLIDTISVRHVSGGWSTLGIKAYAQGRGAFEGTAQHGIWVDEEPPMDVYAEALTRTLTTSGIVLATFTPLEGMSDVVMAFLDAPKEATGRAWFQCGWEDVPHLDADAKRELLASIPPYQREARSKGTPQLGSGAVFQVAEAFLVVDPFAVPAHFPRSYGLDVGWNRTAAVWVARDPETDVIYLTHEYERSEAEPALHATAIRAKGEWQWGAIDPAANGRSQRDGSQLIQVYRDQGLNLVDADNAVEAGLFDMLDRMSTGRLKVFSTCQGWLREFRLYRRDEKGRIVKRDDHLMDASRYAVRGISAIGRTMAEPQARGPTMPIRLHTHATSWMGI